MKRVVGFVFLGGIVFSSISFAQTADRAYSAVIREVGSYQNGCGPSGWPQWATAAASWLSGNGGACNKHDIDYGTLGMSKSEADDRLFNALKLESWTPVPAIASTYWAILRVEGSSAYRNAQMESSTEFRQIHHGNEWMPGMGRWHPSNGHIRMSFPECTPACRNFGW
jgi:hypothetical protein